MYHQDDITEHVPVQDLFVNGLAGIEDMGDGNMRFTFYVLRRSNIYKDHRVEKVLAPVAVIMHANSARFAADATTLAANGIQGLIHGVLVERANGDLN